MPPCLDTDGHFITANTALKLQALRLQKLCPPDEIIDQKLKILLRTNERLTRKMDAAKFLDEVKQGLWNDPDVPSFRILKDKYDNEAWHFRGEEK